MIYVLCRFIVDGNWCLSSSSPVFRDDCGYENHIISVPRSTNTSVSRVLSSVC